MFLPLNIISQPYHRIRCVEQGQPSRRLICHSRPCNMRVPRATWHDRVILYARANDSSYYAVKPSAINIGMILEAARRRVRTDPTSGNAVIKWPFFLAMIKDARLDYIKSNRTTTGPAVHYSNGSPIFAILFSSDDLLFLLRLSPIRVGCFARFFSSLNLSIFSDYDG